MTVSPRRMTGVRIAYDDVPAAVRAWVERELGGEVAHVEPRVGGMSPAAAVTARTDAGERAFVKAVGPEINPDTPSHFRHEIEVLSALPPVPYRARLLASYDDGEWVAILLEDIDGGQPDLDDLTVRSVVLETVQEQSRELRGAADPSGSRTITDLAHDVWAAMLADPGPSEMAGLPDWFRGDLHNLRRRIVDGLGLIVDDTFCNFDVRHDNLLMRAGAHEGGQPVIVDWGQSRVGPRWIDTAVFGLDWVDQPVFDEIVATVGPTADEERAITAFLGGFGARVAMIGTLPAPPGLPRLPEFRRELGSRCLEGFSRRLGR
jgi:hypothetical protein